MAKLTNGVERLRKQLYREANALFRTEEYERFFALPLTKKRARFYMIQRGTFILGRRACWAYVQSRAPFDVKQLIWGHERDELAGNEERGAADHYTLGVMEGRTVGLKREHFRKITPCDGTMVCALAWQHSADRLPWLAGTALLGALEIANADEIIKGGGMSHRIADKLSKDLGIPMERQPSNKEHVAVEDEHSAFLFDVAKNHLKTQDDYNQILLGARRTWMINRTWLGLMSVEMAAI
ncbi:MAG: hypothetical protein V3R85_13010 [Alphaproteobacteria bacterium]